MGLAILGISRWRGRKNGVGQDMKVKNRLRLVEYVNEILGRTSYWF